MKPPTQCVLWDKPELLLESLSQRFEALETYEEETHFWRSLLKCRECGQLYFYQFYEEVDWDEGNDSQESIYVPLESKEEVENLKSKLAFELHQCFPRLEKSRVKDADQPTVQWAKEP